MNAPMTKAEALISADIAVLTSFGRQELGKNWKNIPQELAELSGWLLWKWLPPENPGGKLRKVPVYSTTLKNRRGEQGTPEDRANLRPLRDVINAITSPAGQTCAGVGLAMLPEWHMTALDFDKVRDRMTGSIESWVLPHVEGTYYEVSPSDTGIRAFYYGAVKDGKSNTETDGFEAFHAKGFVTVTGAEVGFFTALGKPIPVLPACVLDLVAQRLGHSRTTAGLSNSCGDGDDAFDAVKQRHDDVDLDALRWMLAQLPLERCDDREDWRNTIFAVHHQFTGTEFEEAALDLVDTWSSQSHKHVTGVVPAIWQEAKEQRGGGLVTIGTLKAWLGDTWKNYRKTAVTQEAVVQTLDWSDRIRVADEVLLVGALAAEIRVATISDLDRAALVKMYQRRLKDLKGVTIEIKEVRRLLAAPRPEREAGDMVAIDDPLSLAPEWAKPWFWVNAEDRFFNRQNKQLCSITSFNAQHSRYQGDLLVQEGDSFTRYRPDERMFTHWCVKTVERTGYHPALGETFKLGGLTFANTYRADLYVRPDDGFTDGGRRLATAMERHLVLLLPNGRERDLFRAWLAHNYMHPGVKIRWAPLLKGAPGDGKSFFGELLQLLLGMPNVRTMSADTVQSSPFTGWSTGQCVVVLEEVKFHGHNRFDVVNKLKPYISNNSVELHGKGKDPMNALNVSNYLALTNHDDALPLEEEDRRYFVLFTPFKSKAELESTLFDRYGLTAKQHFDEIFELGRAHPGQLALWLSQVVIPAEFDPNGEAPKTEAKGRMVAQSLPDIEQAILDILDSAKGGDGIIGVSKAVVSTLHLSAAAKKDAAITREVPGRTISRCLKRAGFQMTNGTEAGKARKVRWIGQLTGVWVGSSVAVDLEPSQYVALLNETLTTEFE